MWTQSRKRTWNLKTASTGVQRPGAPADIFPHFTAEAVDLEEDDVDPGTDEDSQDEGVDGGPMRPVPATQDYLDRISAPHHHHVLGTLAVALEVVGELWEEGRTSLVGAIAHFFSVLDVEDEGRAASMSVAVLRRYTAGYREWHDGMVLPPYWQQWVEVAVERIVRDASFPTDADADDSGIPQTAPQSLVPGAAATAEGDLVDEESADHVQLMQEGGRRLTVVERLIRPSRPHEWREVVARLTQGSRVAADRVRVALRAWLSRRVHRVGHLFYTLGLMLRDTLHATDEGSLSDDQTSWVRDVQESALADLESWYERRCLQGHEVTLPFLVQECLRQAVRLDEMDTSLFDLLFPAMLHFARLLRRPCQKVDLVQ